MIPKIPNKKNRKTSSFKHVVGYVVDDAKQDDGDTHLVNLLSERTAAAEMRAVSGLSKRVDDPVFHAVLSWPQNENPSQRDVYESADYALRSLGFDLDKGGHSAVYAIHRDTDNVHVHIIANRVHPETGLALDLWQSQQRLHKACRELELQHGWTPSNGSWVVKDGEVVRAQYQSEQRENPTEGDVRAQIGQSFGDYVRSAGQSKIIYSADNWQSYHDALNHFNLEITPRGGGFVITDKDSPDQYHIQGGTLGSRYKAAALKQRFGEYQPNTNNKHLAQVRYHDPRKAPVSKRKRQRDPLLKEHRKEARDTLFATYQREKKEFYETQKAVKQQLWGQQRIKEKSRWNDHIRIHRENRKAVMDDTPRGRRRMVSSMLSLEKAQHKMRLDDLRKSERVSLKEQLSDTQAFMNWRQWVRAQASEGNPVAISVYRGLRYRDKGTDYFTSDHIPRQSSEDSVVDIQDVYAVDMREGIGFWVGQKHFATDHGQDIAVRDAEKDSIELSLRIALAKWGGRVEVNGSNEFVSTAKDIAKSIGYDLKQYDNLTQEDVHRPIQRM